MFGLHFKTLLPAIIFSLCILEMSFGLSIQFYVVWWFYLYFIWSVLDISFISTSNLSVFKINSALLLLYFLSCSIFILHHFFGNELYQESTSEAFNILWWTSFGALLLIQLIKTRVKFGTFLIYVSSIVFFGSIISAALGILKYINLLSGNLLNSYYYEDNLLLGSSLSSDYNVYALGLSIGALFSIVVHKNITKKYLKYLYFLAITLIILAILLSGSRRGVVMSVFVIYSLVYSNRIMNARKQIALISTIYIPVIIIFLISINWDKISELILSTELLDQSISRVLTLKDQIQGENERTIRFSWSLDFFLGRSSFEQIFGSGFEYLKLMGQKFSGELEDNPHNFLFSVLLYGGLFGFFVMILLIYAVINASFCFHRFLYPVLLIVLFFGLTSSNSLFSLRIFPTLIFIMSIRINKKNTIEKIS
jgi:hypothetical protein